MKTNYEKNGGNGGSTRNRLDTLAETLGVHITYHRAGQPGWYNHHRKQISLRHGMSTPQENSVLAHELGHAVRSGWGRNYKGVADNGHAFTTPQLSPKGQDIAWKWIVKAIEEHGAELNPRKAA